MEITAIISAVAENEKLLKKLFIEMVKDELVDSVSYGFIRPTKKNRLEREWCGFQEEKIWTNFPLGYNLCFSYDENDVNWEYCMGKYAKILMNKGCVWIEFRNSISPDYSVLMMTTTDGSYLTYDTEHGDVWKDPEIAERTDAEAISAVYYCENAYGGGLWKSKDFTEEIKPDRQYKLQKEKDFGELMKLLEEKYLADKASSYAQIESEVRLGSFQMLSNWTAVKNYIKEQYNMTAAAYFKQEGFIGKTKGAPAKKKDSENPLISMMRRAVESHGLTLEDLLGPEDNDLDLDDFDLEDLDFEDDEYNEDVLEFKKEVEDIVEKLTKKYNGKPRFASYAALKRENTDIDWEYVENTIKNFINSTPAAYFKETGLVRSGKEKEQIIGSVKKATPPPPVGNELDLHGATTIERSQLSGYRTQKKIIIPEGVTKIESWAFRACSSLEEVVFPRSLREIGEFAFEDCFALEKIKLQKGIKQIGMYAFAATNRLREVRLPDSLKRVSRTVFGSGDKLSHATVHMSIDLACRLRDNESVNDPVLARRYVIGGIEYESMPAFFEALEKGKTELKTDRENSTKAKQDTQLKETLKRLKETEDRKRAAYDSTEKKRLAIYAYEGKRISDADLLEAIASEFDKLGDYTDAEAKAKQCRDFAEAIRGSYYKTATEKLENASTVSEVYAARNIFQALGIGYRNASGYLMECRKKEELLKRLADLASRMYLLDQSQEVSESQALEYETLAEEYKKLEGETFRYNACMGKAEGIRKTIEEKKQLREKIDTLYQEQKSFRLLFNGRKRKELQQEIEALEEKLEKM